MIPLDATKPPSETWSSAGRTSMARSWELRKTLNRRVRVSTPIPTKVISW
jgi:hypothetical protein